MSELLAPYRERYFISGEINSEVADPRRRWRRSPSATPTPRQERLDGISIDYEDWHFNVRPSNTEPLLRLCLESLRLARGHGAPPRRGARADPLVSATPTSRTDRAEAARRWRSARRGGHPPPGDPHAVQVGRVNAYLIEDSPLTLVDSGPNSAKALDELEQALAARGHAIEDIELLVITHQHIDHFGLASILARRSGAEVAALERAGAATCATTRSETELDDRFAERMMLRHGIPPTSSPRCARSRRASARGARRWRSRGRCATARSWSCATARCACCTAPATAPRTRSSTTSRRSILLAADHLIAHISSNPLLARPLEARARLRRAPPAGAGHLHRLAAEDTRDGPRRSCCPATAQPITDHAALIDERFRLHDRRAEKIHGLIAEQPRTAHEIAQELWGNVAVTQAYLTLSEVLGHVDLLLGDGRVGRRGARRRRALPRRLARRP